MSSATPPCEALIARDLFGGAMSMSLPSRLVDVSDYRPVPDHQEVWADGATDQSLVVELVEAAAAEAGACGRFYFDDMASVNDSGESSVRGVEELGLASLPSLPGVEGLYACLVTGTQLVSKSRQDSDASNAVLLLLAVLRLPKVGSDLLITLNTPLHISEHSTSAENVNATGVQQGADLARPLLLSMLVSLSIRDWGLFGADK
ncbi:hypothetical protein FOA52_013365 [Chlamydomonas sp. UWO 241]|nr:hypothetical protein FOA52_013365 [Chlamydomonas sp. UWO 241]